MLAWGSRGQSGASPGLKRKPPLQQPDLKVSSRAMHDFIGPERNLQGTPTRGRQGAQQAPYLPYLPYLPHLPPLSTTPYHYLAYRCQRCPRIEIGPIARFRASKFSSVGGAPRGPLPSVPVDSEHQNFGLSRGRNHMTFRAALRAVPRAPRASPWKNIRNWNGGVSSGSPGLARGQVGAKRAKMEGSGPPGLKGPTPFSRGQRGRFWICRRRTYYSTYYTYLNF